MSKPAEFQNQRVTKCLFNSNLEKILAKEPGMFELNMDDMSQFSRIFNTLMGTKTFTEIEISPLHYQQMDVVSFHQMRTEQFLIQVKLYGN